MSHDETDIGCPCCDVDTDPAEWYDRDDHQRAVERLQSLNKIECIHDPGWEYNDIVIHTPYFTTEVVQDVVDHFGLSIVSAGADLPDTHAWDCVQEKGPMFGILLTHRGRQQAFPAEAEISTIDHDYAPPETKLFDRNS